MKEFGGRVAAITGAASGIGRALAEELARRSCHLALCDVDDAGLGETVTSCEAFAVKVTADHVDVADRAAVFAWADDVVGGHGTVDLVVNNAGVALGANVDAMSYEDFAWLMGVNFWGVVHGTQAFLPHLQAGGKGHIVNVSSVLGLCAAPTLSAYTSSKFAVRGFTEALRIELDAAQNGVSCTVVHPGGIKTNIARNARVDESIESTTGRSQHDFERLAMTTPQKAARLILRAVERDQPRALIGPDAGLFALASHLPLRVYQGLVARGVRRSLRG